MAHRQLGRADLVARLLVGRRGEDLGLREGAAPTAAPPRGARRRAGRRRARRSRRSPMPSARSSVVRPERGCASTSTLWPKARGPSRSTARTSGSPGASGASSRRWGGAAVRSSKCLRSPSGLWPFTRLDPDERAVALAPARLPGGAAHLVARTQLAAADLRGGDVDVALRLAHAAQPQEAVALRHPVEHAGDLLGLGLGLRAPPPALPAQTSPPRRRRPARASARAWGASASSGGVPFSTSLDRLDQLVASQHPVARHAELARPLVQVGQMFVLEGHRRGHARRPDRATAHARRRAPCSDRAPRPRPHRLQASASSDTREELQPSSSPSAAATASTRAPSRSSRAADQPEPGPPQQHVGDRAGLLAPGRDHHLGHQVRVAGDDRLGQLRGAPRRGRAPPAPRARSGRRAGRSRPREARRPSRGRPGAPTCPAGCRRCGTPPRARRARRSDRRPGRPSAGRWSACRR